MAFGNKRGGLDMSGLSGRGGRGPRNSGGLSFAGQKGRSAAAERRANRNAMAQTGPGMQIAGRGPAGRRRMIVPVLIVILALAAAIGVGAVVYNQTVKTAMKPVLDEERLNAALVAPDGATDPFWSLLVLTDSDSAAKSRGLVTDLAFIRVDPQEDEAAFLWVPANTRVYVAGYGYRTIRDILETGELDAHLTPEEMMVGVASDLANVDIAHYIEVNEAGMDAYLSNVGRLSVDASNANRQQIAEALVKKILGSSNEQIPVQARLICDYMATDVGEDEMTELLRALQGLDMETSFHQGDMPLSDDSTSEYSVVAADLWATMVERVANGHSPIASEAELSTYEVMRESTEVTIWNGVGVSGIAGDCSDHLNNLGWKVGEVTNAASFVYTETLVVYTFDSQRELAELLVTDLGQGRVVRSAARYSFTGDLLVVVGEDYQPH